MPAEVAGNPVAERDVVRALVRTLETQGARTVRPDLPHVEVKVPFFRLRPNGDFVAPFDRIDLWLEQPAGGPATLRYRLSTARLALTGLAVLAGLLALVHARELSIPDDIVWFFPVGWLWIVGMNYVIALFRANRFLEKSLRRAATDIAHQRASHV